MESVENKIKLYKKILAVMEKVTHIAKDMKVPVGGSGYKAISETAVIVPIREAMIANKLVMIPVEINHTVRDFETKKEYGGKIQYGTNHLSIMDNKYKLIDVETGEHEIICASGAGVDSQDKSPGAAMTYAGKYALLKAFLIPTGQDPDSKGSEPNDNVPPSTSTAPPPSNSNPTAATGKDHSASLGDGDIPFVDGKVDQYGYAKTTLSLPTDYWDNKETYRADGMGSYKSEDGFYYQNLRIR